ncbi:hypothetical protein ACEWY4_010036 [Coilia grayii]|uniref:G-protein coupled receptors family 1 profile domain-containing protein n=1 Tax=Coilia grayii TaxID=363190 RepID=A0ABD1K846_9TELE
MQNTTEFVNNSGFVNEGVPVKAFLSMTPCFFFLYVNLVMLFTLRSKDIFCETPRYILFTHLLFTDSLQLSASIVTYLFAVARLYLVSYACVLIYLLFRMINVISPLYLALMSMERYVAICFPLRHTQIADKRRTTVAAVGVWMLGLLKWTAELSANVTFVVHYSTRHMMCSQYIVLEMEVSVSMNRAFLGITFTLVSLAITYTYVAILVTAKSSSSSSSNSKASVGKAHKTILLHMVQLGLTLVSTLFSEVRKSLVISQMNPVLFFQVQYVLFVGVVIFPKCLSPLIYGLRDKTFSVFFKHNFFFCIKRKAQPSVAII